MPLYTIRILRNMDNSYVNNIHVYLKQLHVISDSTIVSIAKLLTDTGNHTTVTSYTVLFKNYQLHTRREKF